jgi:hypothetical protein
MATEQPVYRYENDLERYVPELGVVLDLTCVELTNHQGCPSKSLHTDHD